MAINLFQRIAINEDANAEFSFWKKHFVSSAWTAVGFALATCFVIAAWPVDIGDPELRAFARHFWTLLAECMFWLGFLIGLMWAGAKRFGSALSGTLPWQPARQIGAVLARARLLGQWAAGFFLCAVGVRLTSQLAMQAGVHGADALIVMQDIALAAFAGAALCAAGAVLERQRIHARH